jgi:hypothetical protein
MFSRHIQTFADTLDGLRSFVNLVQPFLDKQGREIEKKHAGNLIPLVLGFAKSDPSLLKTLGLKESRLRHLFNGDIKIREGKEGSQPSFTVKVSGPQSQAFEKAISEIAQAKGSVSLLHQNSLISLISAVECFLSQIIHTYYDTVPGAMSDKEKVFSFDDLRNFDTVEDARVYLIEKKVTDLMRGSFTDWITFFRAQADLSMSYLDPYMDTLVETCERRNLLIHNAGVINSIYLSKVSSDLRKGKKKGSKLHLTRKYLDDRIDYFELHSILIAAELWKKLRPADDRRADILASIAYNHLLHSRWGIAEGLSYFMMMDKKMKEPWRLVGKLNYWQSAKRQGRWEEVKDEAEAEDLSAKGRRYQLGHLALIGKKPEFFALVPVALTGKEISLDELREWPIFEDMRKDRRFAQYKPSVAKKDKRKRALSGTSPKKMPTKKKAPAKASRTTR